MIMPLMSRTWRKWQCVTSSEKAWLLLLVFHLRPLTLGESLSHGDALLGKVLSPPANSQVSGTCWKQNEPHVRLPVSAAPCASCCSLRRDLAQNHPVKPLRVPHTETMKE